MVEGPGGWRRLRARRGVPTARPGFHLGPVPGTAIFLVAAAIVLALVVVLTLRPWSTEADAAVHIDPAHPCGNQPPRTAPSRYKVMVIIAENENRDDVVDNTANAPYQNMIGARCGLQVNGYAVTHWSEANYLALTSGTVPPWSLDDCVPSPSCSGDIPNIFKYLQDAGRTWKNYAESAPGTCYGQGYPSNDKSAIYVPRHVPPLYYTNLADVCSQNVVPMGDLAGRSGAFFTDLAIGLPDLSFVTPNQINNAHDSEPRDFDNWLAGVLPRVLESPDYRAGRLVVFVTNDEGSGHDQSKGENCVDQALAVRQPSCRIPAWVIGPWVPAGVRDGTFYTHYAVLRTMQELLDLTPGTGHPWLGHAGDPGQVSLTRGFNLLPGRPSS